MERRGGAAPKLMTVATLRRGGCTAMGAVAGANVAAGAGAGARCCAKSVEAGTKAGWGAAAAAAARSASTAARRACAATRRASMAARCSAESGAEGGTIEAGAAGETDAGGASGVVASAAASGRGGAAGVTAAALLVGSGARQYDDATWRQNGTRCHRRAAARKSSAKTGAARERDSKKALAAVALPSGARRGPAKWRQTGRAPSGEQGEQPRRRSGRRGCLGRRSAAQQQLRHLRLAHAVPRDHSKG